MGLREQIHTKTLVCAALEREVSGEARPEGQPLLMPPPKDLKLTMERIVDISEEVVSVWVCGARGLPFHSGLTSDISISPKKERLETVQTSGV